MSTAMHEMINFHLTGKRDSTDAAEVPATDDYPALLAPYRDLADLRYDFPLIFLDDPDTLAIADTLTGVINRLLRDIAPAGSAGEQLRQHVLRLEARMRELVAGGFDSSLPELWKQAGKLLLAECDAGDSELLENSFAAARFALGTDGRVVDCDSHLPVRLLEHAWKKSEARRAGTSQLKISSLIIRLRNILKVDDLKNGVSRTPKNLQKTLGRGYKEDFDFDLMSELLDDATPRNRLPAGRRTRIQAALTVLESQQFFVSADDRYQFVFDSLSAALKAYKERLPEIANVIKAISVAELECENDFREETHSGYFDRYGPQAIAVEDLALFPSYLICLHESDSITHDLISLMEVARSDLPMKVLVQQDSFEQQLAQTFMAGSAYVLQSAASNLYRQEEHIRKGMEFAGPAIFSVFAPFYDSTTQLPVYLRAAAAMESRVFPAFSYDPAAGPGLAERFDISSNPAVQADWPRGELRYEDAELQTIAEDYAFTPADFALTDAQYSDHFAVASKESWNDDMLPVVDYLELADADSFEKVPYVAVVDGENMLRRLVVDDNMIRIVRRCRDRWHALQELGSVNNSYVRAVPNETVPVETKQLEAEAEPEAEVEQLEAEPVAAADDAFIETPRCTTCDECTDRNDRMFAYDENKQAYIKDPDAGTYRQLIEAAEVCQVAIIHPGKPRNPDEPGLDELIARAEPFG